MKNGKIILGLIVLIVIGILLYLFVFKKKDNQINKSILEGKSRLYSQDSEKGIILASMIYFSMVTMIEIYSSGDLKNSNMVSVDINKFEKFLPEILDAIYYSTKCKDNGDVTNDFNLCITKFIAVSFWKVTQDTSIIEDYNQTMAQIIGTQVTPANRSTAWKLYGFDMNKIQLDNYPFV